MLHLSPRLARAEELAGPCGLLVDVGANHGRLPVHMLQAGLCQSALLVDVSAPALEQARALVERTGLCGRAQLLCQDGLAGISLEGDTVVTLCGMGARLIARLIGEGLPCPAVLQPNVETAYLRGYLNAHHMRIEREALAREGGRYYCLLRALPGEQALTEREQLLSPFLLQDQSGHLAGYLRWRYGVASRTQALGGAEREHARRARLEKELIETAWEALGYDSGGLGSGDGGGSARSAGGAMG